MKKLPVYIAFALYNDFLFKDYTETLSKIDIPLLLCCADSPAIPGDRNGAVLSGFGEW